MASSVLPPGPLLDSLTVAILSMEPTSQLINFDFGKSKKPCSYKFPSFPLIGGLELRGVASPTTKARLLFAGRPKCLEWGCK